MLRSLRSDDERFKALHFRPGLNLLIADRTDRSADTDSRNGVGKTSTVELLHYLLGATTRKSSLWSHKALSRHRFRLVMDWPRWEKPVTIERRPASPKIYLQPDVSRHPDFHHPGHLFEDALAAEVTLKDWQWVIERDLYRVTSPDSPVSGRTLLSFAIRRVDAGGFLQPTSSFSGQSPHEAMISLSHLFGLDVGLVTEYRTLSQQDATRKKLVEATKDPVWGKIVGRSAELRGEITAVEQRIAELREQIQRFQVVPGYEDLRREADALDRQIRELRDLDEVERHNLQQMVRATTDAAEPDDRYLEQAFQQLNVVLNGEVRRRFDEVRAFHETVVRNREKQLREETDRLERRLAEREREREQLGQTLASILQTLNQGGALDALTSLQSVLAREQATLEALRNRFQAAQTLEASRREIEARRLELESALADDLNDRAEITSEVSRLFNVFARRLYGQTHNPYLAFEARKQRLDIETRIDADGSRGIHNMVIFCFDLTAAVIAHRHGRGPDFLVHDSHLYDGVDERQVSAALQLAADVMADENMQYIVTMNTDDLRKAEAKGFDPGPHVIEPRLTDQPDGGLFGFRF
ncbi:hypothetical protein Acsp03_71120 [Actinomadura sp. NBRC 104412]|uniref:ABC-three component system protein n=1 Tax=Actinomadura sp. NBRC 104412 TaxID=3032203 RepID=UPI0024A0262D|nr:ABC-three component system protein [Actinomadura sp. NBRC 104412]GLZ09646.1 hypothetical protein Acsp03_71120 [Actinomadura sp. NBRC 104412]